MLWLIALGVAALALALGHRKIWRQADPATSQRPVLFFDGVCGLCNAAVDFAIAHDPAQLLLFAPLQGDHAAQVVGPEPAGGWQSLVLVDAAGTHKQSDAALRLAGQLGGVWRLALVVWMVPRPLRNWVYDGIARNRYRMFGKKESCRIPTPAERKRFLG